MSPEPHPESPRYTLPHPGLPTLDVRLAPKPVAARLWVRPFPYGGSCRPGSPSARVLFAEVEMDRALLADFLRARREVLQPEDVGLPRGPRRRTGGCGARRWPRRLVCRPVPAGWRRRGTRRPGCSRCVLRCRCTAAAPPCRGPALLHEAGLVDDKDTAIGAQVFDGIGADVVAGGIRVPAGVAQQALHRPGPGMAGLFGQLPAVLPLDTRQRPEQVGAGGRSGLHPPEPARDPGANPDRGIRSDRTE